MVGTGERIGEQLHSPDPRDPDSVVAVAACATASEVAAAVAEAERGASYGERSPPRSGRRRWSERQRGCEHRLEITALEVRECAKPQPEADADVSRRPISLSTTPRSDRSTWGRHCCRFPARHDMRYGPRGVTAVVAPWNFPVAIPCGMTSAALATGNAVILKPAESRRDAR